MKTNLLHASIAAVLAAASALAQGPTPFKVNVPFDFVVGNTTLEAGHYSVSEASPDAVAIKCSGCKGIAITIGSRLYARDARQSARLVFHRYRNVYFLEQVWGPDAAGHQVPKSKREQELSAGLTPRTVILAALR